MVSRSTESTPGAFAVGQAQAAADGLLNKRLGVRGAQGDDGVEVGDVPAFLEHIHVDDDLRRVLRLLHGDQLFDGLVLLFAPEVGVDRDDLPFIAALEEGVVLDQLQDGVGVVRVLGDDQHERLDDGTLFSRA